MDARTFVAVLVTSSLFIPRPAGSQEFGSADTGKLAASGPFEDCMSREIAAAGAGAFVGGILGAVTGIVKGGPKSNNNDSQIVRGAAVGAIVGLVAAWGKCYSKTAKIKSEPVAVYETAAAQIGYKPAGGLALEIRDAFIDPAAVPPNAGILRVVVPYYVLTPNPRADVQVQESQDLYVKNKQTHVFEKLGGTQETIVAKPGLRKGGGDIPLPGNIDEGDYKITYTVTAQGKPSIAQLPFSITKDPRTLSRAQSDASVARQKFEHLGSDDTRVAAAAPSATTMGQQDAGGKGMQAPAAAGMKTVLVSGVSATLRSQPDTTASIVTTVRKGEQFPVSETVQLAGRKWLLVVTDDGTKGWIAENAVKVLP